MLDTKDILLVLGIVSSLVISILSARGQFNRIPSQNSKDDAYAGKNKVDTIKILQDMVDEKAEELKRKQDAYTEEITGLRVDLAEVKRLSQIPFRVTLEGLTYPAPKILKAEIEILPEIRTVTVNEGNS